MQCISDYFFFFFNDTATTEIYTLSLHDALPISCLKCPARTTCSYGSRRCGSLRTNTTPPADRKSTRLNSSHLVISYAVFCLKKKKKNIIIHAHLYVGDVVMLEVSRERVDTALTI